MAELGSLLSSITHQWKQPISAISLYVQSLDLLLENDIYTKEDLVKITKNLHNQVMFMDETIDDFKNFIVPQKETSDFSIDHSIQKIYNLLKQRYHKYDVSFDIKSDPICTLHGYANEFEHVILNLMNNAIDEFSKRKANNNKISIETSYINDVSIILFKDNAGGISEELLPSKLFDEYITTKNKEFGTGIGLNLTRKIIEDNFKGQIEAYNEEDGAIFKITI